jgi:tetratricopeptide (TPR) repeat protein
MNSSENPWLHYLMIGLRFFKEKNYPESIDAFQKSIALNEHWESYQGLGWALFRTDNDPAAIDAFNKSIALNEQWKSYQGLGWALFRTNKDSAAFDAFNKSIALNEHWESYQGLGWALFRTKNDQAAIDAFNKSIALNEHWESYQGLGSALFRAKKLAAAIDAFNKSIALNEHWNTYQGLGWALIRTNNDQAAIDAFNKSIALNEHWKSFQGLGLTLFRTQNFAAAIDVFNKSIALNEHWKSYQGLGWALIRTNNDPAAIDAFNKSIALNEHWESYQGLGLALFRIKNFAAAIVSIINSYALNKSEEIKKQYYKIYLQAGNERDPACKFASFLEYSIFNKNQLAEACLKEFILNNSKTQRIDSILLRHASLITRDSANESIKPLDRHLLDNLSATNIQKERSFVGISGFHRYVFGVSHSKLHLASPNTTVIYCGAGTMFSIGDPKSRTKHFQTINSALETINPQNSVLIFEFGEIDIRNHIFRIAKKKSQSIKSIADASISRYIEFLKTTKSKGYHVMVSGPHCGGGECHSIVSAVERNDLCAYINDSLNLECRANGFYFFTLFDKVVNQTTLKEITGLYRDPIHLFLPPSKIGNALNAFLTQKVDAAFSPNRSNIQLLQQEEVKYECNLVVSDIPNWQTGKAFYPGKEMPSSEEPFEIGQYMLLIELPFLMHPNQITLEFEQPALNIKTAVQGVLESWDVYKDTQEVNIIHGLFLRDAGSSKSTTIRHSFAARKSHEEMCRFLLVKVSANAIGNHLTAIHITRWVHQYPGKD